MFTFNKSFLDNLLIIALFLLPIFKAAANDVPQHIKQLQTMLMKTDEKITLLAVDQVNTKQTISNLQTSLRTVHQEINLLNNSGEPDQLDAIDATIHRTANGHGRGGR